MTDLDALRAMVAKAVHALQAQPIRTHWDGCEEHHPYCMVAQLTKNLPALLDELVAARLAVRVRDQDAERYRWLRDHMTHEQCGPNVGWTIGTLLPGDDPDAAIDAARGER